MSNSRASEATIQNTAAQAAVNVGHTLVPLATLLAWKAQLAIAENDAITINRMGKILVESETDLKAAKEEAINIAKQLTISLKDNVTLQKDVIQINNLLTDAHTKYANRLEGFTNAIVQSHDRIINLEAEIAQLKRDLPKRD